MASHQGGSSSCLRCRPLCPFQLAAVLGLALPLGTPPSVGSDVPSASCHCRASRHSALTIPLRRAVTVPTGRGHRELGRADNGLVAMQGGRGRARMLGQPLRPSLTVLSPAGPRQILPARCPQLCMLPRPLALATWWRPCVLSPDHTVDRLPASCMGEGPSPRVQMAVSLLGVLHLQDARLSHTWGLRALRLPGRATHLAECRCGLSGSNVLFLLELSQHQPLPLQDVVQSLRWSRS